MWSQVLLSPRCMELQDVAAPTPADLGEDEVIVEFLCGGICGSDAPHFYGEPASISQPGTRGSHCTKSLVGSSRRHRQTYT